jgi:hypothetical protein
MHGSRLPGVERAVLDACSLVNLYATRRIAEILGAVPIDFCVCEYVLRNEATYILSSSPTDGAEAKEPIDLSAVIAKGLLDTVTLDSDAEAATYISLSMEVDDGEAQTISVAAHRGMGVVTDDRLARNLITNRAIAPLVLTTGEVLQLWAGEANASDAEIREALSNVEVGGRFRPPRNDPAYGWWRNYV